MNIGYSSWLGSSGLKQFAITSGLSVHRNDEGDNWYIFVMDGAVIHDARVAKDSADGQDLDTSYESLTGRVLSSSKIYVNKTTEAYSLASKLVMVPEKNTNSKATIVTHDWTNPTTWFHSSVRIDSEVLSNSGDNQTYIFSHNNIIDTFHGNITQEDYLTKDGYSFRVDIKVDGLAKQEQDPHFGYGGDYVIDYDDGYITFLTTLSAEAEVTATYHYATSSEYCVCPTAGKALIIDKVEVQFSEDVIITDAVKFQAYGFVDVFAPQLMPYVPSGTKIPLGAPLVYKGMRDFMNDSTKSYVSYPPLSPSTWRGTAQPTVVFDWDYVAATLLRSDYGMEIKVYLEHNESFGGSYATATFYCTSEDL